MLDLLASSEPNPAVQYTAEERRRWASETIAAMPQGFREAIELVYFQDLKYREAAEVLNVPVGTVKSRVHAAVNKLTEAWNELFPGEILAAVKADETSPTFSRAIGSAICSEHWDSKECIEVERALAECPVAAAEFERSRDLLDTVGLLDEPIKRNHLSASPPAP